MILNHNTSNVYVLKEDYADMMLGHLAKNNMGHLFHKLKEPIGFETFFNQICIYIYIIIFQNIHALT